MSVWFCIQILKHEWPARWRSFIPDLVAAAKTSETICENCMTILKVCIFSYRMFKFPVCETMTLRLFILIFSFWVKKYLISREEKWLSRRSKSLNNHLTGKFVGKFRNIYVLSCDLLAVAWDSILLHMVTCISDIIYLIKSGLKLNTSYPLSKEYFCNWFESKSFLSLRALLLLFYFDRISYFFGNKQQDMLLYVRLDP